MLWLLLLRLLAVAGVITLIGHDARIARAI